METRLDQHCDIRNSAVSCHYRVSMACQCLSARVMSFPAAETSHSRRPLQLSTCIRSQTSASSGWSRISSSTQWSRSCGGKAPFTNAQRQSVRQQHRLMTQAYNQKPDVADRVVASVPYLIPLIDGLRYGKQMMGLESTNLTAAPTIGSTHCRKVFLCAVPCIC